MFARGVNFFKATAGRLDIASHFTSISRSKTNHVGGLLVHAIVNKNPLRFDFALKSAMNCCDTQREDNLYNALFVAAEYGDAESIAKLVREAELNVHVKDEATGLTLFEAAEKEPAARDLLNKLSIEQADLARRTPCGLGE